VGWRSEELYRDRSQYRRIVVTLYPVGFIGLRLARGLKTAVQTRVIRERAQRRGAKPCLARRGRL
jgi:hypothetical protein